MKEEIRKLLKSNNIDDIILGLRVLHKKYSRAERHDFFDEFNQDRDKWIYHNSETEEITIKIGRTYYIIWNGSMIISGYSRNTEDFEAVQVLMDDPNQEIIKY